MLTQDSTPLSSTHIRPSSWEHPLSAQGRLNRLSYIANWGLLHILYGLSLILLNLSFDTLQPQALDIEQNVSSFAVVELSSFVLTALYLYSIFILIIRRLHDLNKSGWMSLLLFIPLINLVVLVWLIFAQGCSRTNRFGHPRASTNVERFLLIGLLLLFVTNAFNLKNMMTDSYDASFMRPHPSTQ